ncbi:hypothetical protein CYMTET_37111 [Cymbomonas tetramitiformis]|uniref:MYND-type domain-containing protein n=1 Tax=Cymbomonas tetramitiformis TaxID=36881 RepID=A0AAE0F6Z4_9CHLO|nr:hypothetical protein CYMTET_37111 [Cymbomonas tetramitiformis]
MFKGSVLPQPRKKEPLLGSLSWTQDLRSERAALVVFQAAASSARSLLGPHPARKCLQDSQDSEGGELLGSQVERLLEALAHCQQHPAVHLLSTAAHAQVKSAGSGAAWMAVLSGLLMSTADRLLSEGVPQDAVLAGLNSGAALVRETIRKAALPCAEVVRFMDREALRSFLIGVRGHVLVVPAEADTASMILAQSCWGCGLQQAQLSRCSICKVAKYCSAACQRGHWRIHKPNCSKDTMQSQASTATSDISSPEPREQQAEATRQEKQLAALGIGLAHGQTLPMQLALAMALQQQPRLPPALGGLVDAPAGLCLEHLWVERLVGPPSHVSFVIPGVCVPVHADMVDVQDLQQVVPYQSISTQDAEESYWKWSKPTGMQRCGWRIAVLEGSVSGAHRSEDCIARSAEDLTAVAGAQNAKISKVAQQLIQRLRACQAELLVASGDVPKDIRRQCAAAGFLVLANLGVRRAAHLAKATGGQLALDAMRISPRHVGSCPLHLQVLEGGCSEEELMTSPHPHARGAAIRSPQFLLRMQVGDKASRMQPVSTAVICSPIEALALEMEAGVWRCLKRLRGTLEQGCVLLGAGRMELLCIDALQAAEAEAVAKLPRQGLQESMVPDLAVNQDYQLYEPLLLAGWADSLRQVLHIALQNFGMGYSEAATTVSNRLADLKQRASGRRVDLKVEDSEGSEACDSLTEEFSLDDLQSRISGVNSAMHLLHMLLNADGVITNQSQFHNELR